MKKVFVMALVAIMAISNVEAGNRSCNESEVVNYNLSLSLREMNKVLNLNVEQSEIMGHANDCLTRKVAHLIKVAPEKRSERLAQYLTENLAYAYNVLSQSQYRAYLTILNREFTVNKLTDVLYERDLAVE